MKNLEYMIQLLEQGEQLHKDDTYNYTIPEAWNTYGYPYLRRLQDHQIIVHPYSFYTFALKHLCQDVPSTSWDRSAPWLSSAVVYAMMVRTQSAWDHDRDGHIDHDNLYHMADTGTFLKCIVLLPLLKRMGVNTILLQQPFALAKTAKAHTYAPREAVRDFRSFDEHIVDPLLTGMSALQQGSAFIEACHLQQMHVVLEYCPGMMARDNVYIEKHPNWFYWIDADYLSSYHAPICHTLPQNTIPYAYTLKDLYRSEDVLQHITKFQKAPQAEKGATLASILSQQNRTIAPSIVDQINAHIEADVDTTLLRYFLDAQPHGDVPYMLQDTIRPDLYAGNVINTTCWKAINAHLTWYQKNLAIDGIYLSKPYYLPVALQKQLVKTARHNHPNFVMIAEDSVAENSERWMEKGYDMISGGGGYEESYIWDYKLHSFAYCLKTNACRMFAASEFHDTRRISCLEHGQTLSILLSMMNYFLPNGIPLLMGGMETFDPQPMQLSVYGDTQYLYGLAKSDARYLQQSWLDNYHYDYLSPSFPRFLTFMQQANALRQSYLDAILDPVRCIPVWFDSPKDYGIGFTYIKEEAALMVVCNVNVAQPQFLHIHTDNLFPHLQRYPQRIQQIYATSDPYIHDCPLDATQNLLLEFAPGEVKFIEFR